MRNFFFAAILNLFLFYGTPAFSQPIDRSQGEALAQAFSRNDESAAMDLLRQNTNLCNAVFWYTRRPLHAAVQNGWEDVVEFLLQHGADPNAEGDIMNTSNSRMTPIEVAVQFDRVAILKRLLAAGANPNHRADFSGPALFEAFTYRRYEMVPVLLDYGADPFLANNRYLAETPIEAAITQSYGQCVPEMLKAGHVKKQERANFLTSHGPAMLEAAAERGELEAVEAFLDADVKARAVSANGLTPIQNVALGYAGAKNQRGFDPERWTKIHELLLHNGCSDDAFSATGFGDLDAARGFFTANASVAQAKDVEGASLLHWSVLSDQLPLTDFWLQSGTSPAATTVAGQTALYLAATRGLTNQVARLLAANAPLDIKDTNGLTAFDAAVLAKQTEVVRMLLGKTPGASGKYGITTPLHAAAASGDVHALTNALATVTPVDARDELGLTAFQIAMTHGHLQAAALLLGAGADVNARDARGNTAMHLIMLQPVGYGYISDEPPLRWYARVRRDPQTANLVGYLLLGGNSQQSDTFTATVFLLANKADDTIINDAGQSVTDLLMGNSVFVVGNERSTLLTLLGKHTRGTGNTLNQRDANGDTALHRAARGSDADKVDELITGGADINATNNMGRTPLHAAVENIMSWPGPLTELLKAGANVNVQDNQGMTPLALLLTTDTSFAKEATASLIEAGANPNARDKQGRTPVHLALSENWPWSPASDSVSLLADAGGNLSATDDQGRTPLHYLAGAGNQNPMFFIHNIGDILIKANVNVMARDNDGNTPLHIAAKTGTKDVFDWLMQHGADLDATNNAGATPLQFALNTTNRFAQFDFDANTDISQAIREGKLESVKAILKAKPQLLNETNRFGLTPLLTAAMLHRTNIAEFLETQGAHWDEVSAAILNRGDVLSNLLAHATFPVNKLRFGGTLLHFAAENDAVDAASVLLAAGADLTVQDALGISPLGAAELRKNTAVANLLIQHGAAENIFDAIYLDDMDAAKKLLARNESLALVTNESRLTLTEIAAATGRDRMLELLLDHRAPLDGTDGWTPLHLAVLYRQTNAVELLIRRGASVDAYDKQGLTPLHLAAIYDSPESAALLLNHPFLKHGANPNAAAMGPRGPQIPPMRFSIPGYSGDTPLHFAASNGETNIIALLLSAGASINVTNAAGLTPLDVASRPGFGSPMFPLGPGRGPIIGPPDIFHPITNRRQPNPLDRNSTVEFLERAGAKHGNNYQPYGMPIVGRAWR